MVLRDGNYLVGSSSGRLLLRTSRAGMGKRAGHDLVIEATAWDGHVTVSNADVAKSTVNIDIGAGSLEVRKGTGGVKSLTDSDRADIKRTIREQILHTAEHPTITFRSTRVEGSAESFIVTGDLIVMGRVRPAEIQGGLADDGTFHGRATIAQTDWGIKPYTAFLGALKLADHVTIEIGATLKPTD